MVCGACGAENRNEAKFCRSCGARLDAASEEPALSAAWAQTQPTELSDSHDERTVMVAPVAKPHAAAARTPAPPAQAAAPTPTSRPARPGASAPTRSLPWAGLLGSVALLLLVGGAAWYFLGTEPGSASVPEAVVAPVVAPVSPPPVPDAPAVVIDAAPLAPVPPAPEPVAAAEVTPVPVPAPPVAAPAAATPSAPRARPRRESPAPVRAAEPEIAPPAVPAPAPAPPPATSPQQACAGLGFVAKARCMATECAKPAQTAHPQCAAVREQQRIEERARNPQAGA